MSIQAKTNKTAVQVIIDFINENKVFKMSNQILVKSFDDLLTEVSLLEKKQIETAFLNGIECGVNNEYAFEDLHAKNYYSQTFKND